jgi:hypothetical protein
MPARSHPVGEREERACSAAFVHARRYNAQVILSAQVWSAQIALAARYAVVLVRS